MTDLARVSVPASCANLGPGYDVLGLALGLRLSATAQLTPEWKITTLGAGAQQLPTTGDNLMARAYGRVCRRRGWSIGPLEVKVDNPIPIGRGLGSSAAAIITGMALAQLLHQGRLDRDELFREAAAMEGHPDNVAPAVYGGLQRVTTQASGVSASAQELAGNVKVLLVIPHAGKSTARMREVVPEEVAPLVQAANDESLRHVLEGLAKGDPKGLRYSAEDRRHQPYRLAVQPESAAIFELLQLNEHVAGVFLSGAGTAIGGWVVGKIDPTEQVRQAVEARLLSASVRLVTPDRLGVQGEILDG